MRNIYSLQTTLSTFRWTLKRWSGIAAELCITNDAPVEVANTFPDRLAIRFNTNPNARKSRGGVIRGLPTVEYAVKALLNDQVDDRHFIFEEESELADIYPKITTTIEIYAACLAAHEVAHAAIFYTDKVNRKVYSEDHGEEWQTLYSFLRKRMIKQATLINVRNLQASVIQTGNILS